MIRRNRLVALIHLGLVGAVIVLGFVAATGQIHACSCAPLEPPRESLAKSTSVFVGRVVSIAESQRDDREYPVVELGEGRTPALGVVGPTPDPSEYRTGGGCQLGSPSPDVSVFGVVVGLLLFRLRRRQGDGIDN